MTHSVEIPGRTLAIISIYNNLNPKQSGSLYEIEPDVKIVEKYPNLYIIPMIHNVDVHRTEHLPLVVINLSMDDVKLSKGESMGYMYVQSLEISEITTEISTEPSLFICEEDEKEVLNRQEGDIVKEKVEKKFITSPTDIEVHRKVELQDANITNEQKQAFKDLCTEFKDIFSTDSGDIGKTPLLEVEIDTGHHTNHPKTLHSSFETYRMGTETVRNPRESWSNSKKCFPLG